MKSRLTPTWMAAALCLMSVTAAHGGELLFSDDFEHGASHKWQPQPRPDGAWRIIAEPGVATNHVLAVTYTGRGGDTIAFGDPAWKDYKLSARFKVLEAKGGGFHVKFACRHREPGGCFFLNSRDTGPCLVRHSGNDYLQLGALGDERIEQGRWYAAELQCAGPVLTGRVRDAATDRVVGELRCLEPSLTAGACGITVFMPPGGTGTFLFDDIRVEAVAATAAAESRGVTVENQALRVEFDRASGRFDVTDLRNKQRWPQALQGASLPDVGAVERRADGRGLRASLKTAAGPVEVTLAIEDPAEVVVTLKPAGPGHRANLAYPWPLLPPSARAELVLPADEGVILPATGVDIPRAVGSYGYQQSGFLMPWFGLVEGERGLMALVETPDDLSINVGKGAAGEKEKPLLTASAVWLPSRDDLRYERRVRFCVFDRGGYVAMAKRYRKYLVDHGRFRTLAQKAEELPDVKKLLGAVDIYDHSAKNDSGVLDWMIAHGIHRALYYGAPDKARNQKALAAGYVTGRYDIYTDIATPELMEAWHAQPQPDDPLRCARTDEAFVRRDGSLQPGFPYPIGTKGGVSSSGEKPKTIRCVYRCSAAKLAWLQKRVPREAAEQALKARFLDVETATQPTECYFDKHPLTRTDDRETRTKLFDYLRSIGQIAASEGGADWPAHALHYQEGSLSLNHFSYIQGVYVGTAPFDLPREYIAAQFDMTRRVPLHKLVYHDSVLMTWRWNHTPNRWVQGAEYWDDWDLLHVLYGGMPIFVVDKKSIEQKGPRILQSCRNIGGVLEKIAGSEMISHGFLTADRQVQETRFANGWAVVVNFAKAVSYNRPGGQPVPPRSFTTYRWR